MRKKDLRKLLQDNINFTAPHFDDAKKDRLSFVADREYKLSPSKKSFPLSFVISFSVLILVVIGISIFPPRMNDSSKWVEDPSISPSESRFTFDENFNLLNDQINPESIILKNYLSSIEGNLESLILEFESYEDIIDQVYRDENLTNDDQYYSGDIVHNSECYEFELAPTTGFMLRVDGTDDGVNKILIIKDEVISLIFETATEKVIFAYEDDITKVLKVSNNTYEYLYSTASESYLYISTDNFVTLTGYYYNNILATSVSAITITDINNIKTEINNLLS